MECFCFWFLLAVAAIIISPLHYLVLMFVPYYRIFAWKTVSYTEKSPRTAKHPVFVCQHTRKFARARTHTNWTHSKIMVRFIVNSLSKTCSSTLVAANESTCIIYLSSSPFLYLCFLANQNWRWAIAETIWLKFNRGKNVKSTVWLFLRCPPYEYHWNAHVYGLFMRKFTTEIVRMRTYCCKQSSIQEPEEEETLTWAVNCFQYTHLLLLFTIWLFSLAHFGFIYKYWTHARTRLCRDEVKINK